MNYHEKKIHGISYIRGEFKGTCGRTINNTLKKAERMDSKKSVVFTQAELNKEVTCDHCVMLADPERRSTGARHLNELNRISYGNLRKKKKQDGAGRVRLLPAFDDEFIERRKQVAALLDEVVLEFLSHELLNGRSINISCRIEVSDKSMTTTGSSRPAVR